MISDAAKIFWREFDAFATVLAEEILCGKLSEAFQHIETLLRKNGFDFSFELTLEGSDAVLVLTPEGSKEEAQRIDNFVQSKHEIRGWRIYTRRQRKSLQDALTFVRHIYGTDMTDATFDLERNSEGYRVIMYSNALNGFTSDEVCGLIETLLDHAVGEVVVMSKVIEVSGKSVGDGQLSLSELVQRLTSN